MPATTLPTQPRPTARRPVTDPDLIGISTSFDARAEVRVEEDRGLVTVRIGGTGSSVRITGLTQDVTRLMVETLRQLRQLEPGVVADTPGPDLVAEQLAEMRAAVDAAGSRPGPLIPSDELVPARAVLSQTGQGIVLLNQSGFSIGILPRAYLGVGIVVGDRMVVRFADGDRWEWAGGPLATGSHVLQEGTWVVTIEAEGHR